MLYYSYTLMFSFFCSIVAMLLCVVLFAPDGVCLSRNKRITYLLTYSVILFSKADTPFYHFTVGGRPRVAL